MTTEETIALVSLVVFLVCQGSLFGYYYGIMKKTVSGLTTNILELKGDISGMGVKIDKNRTKSFDNFVTHVECKGTQQTWDTKVEAMLAQRVLKDEQDAREHKELRLMGKQTYDKLEELMKLIYSLDKRIPDEKTKE